MNTTQIEAFIRQVLPIVGGILAAIGFKNATTWVDTAMQVIGPAMAIVSVVWSFLTNRTSSLISKTANLAEVQSIKLESTAPGALVTATPVNVSK